MVQSSTSLCTRRVLTLLVGGFCIVMCHHEANTELWNLPARPSSCCHVCFMQMCVCEGSGGSETKAISSADTTLNCEEGAAHEVNTFNRFYLNLSE